MQASTRIGIALCVLVAGAALAGLFRKTPDEVVSPAEISEGGLALRQPDQAPFLAAQGSAGWRGKTANSPSPPKGQSQPAAGGASGGALARRRCR